MKKLRHLKHLSVVLVSIFAFTANIINAEISDSNLQGLKLANETKHLKIYVKPGADLDAYSAFVLQSVDVSVDEKWLDRYNRDRKSINSRLNDKDLKKITERYQKGFKKTLERTLDNEGKATLSDTVSANTLKVETTIVNLKLNAPDKKTAGQNSYFIRQAGRAELHTKMFDPETGELLIAIIDKRETREHFDLFEANRVRNQFEFNNVYRKWARNWLASLEQQS